MNMIMHNYWKIFVVSSFIFNDIFTISAEKIIATIEVGKNPSAIAITQNGQFAYVVNNNHHGVASGNTVSVIDLATKQVVKTISHPSFNGPYTITINHRTNKAYVTNSNSTTISIIDIPSNSVVGVIDGFKGPSGMAIMPQGNIAYVVNYGFPNPKPPHIGADNTVRVVDLVHDKIVGPAIKVGSSPAGLAITPDGLYVYVINYVDGNPGTGTMSIIDTSTNQVIGTITGFFGPYQIKITKNGLYAYVTNFGSNNFKPCGNTVSVVDIQNRKIIKNITVGVQPSGITFSPDQRYAYVTNYDTPAAILKSKKLQQTTGTINVIDLQSNTVLPKLFQAGCSPACIALSLDGKSAYVTNYDSNDVSVIDITQ